MYDEESEYLTHERALEGAEEWSMAMRKLDSRYQEDKMNTPRFPDVIVQLANQDGSAFAILGRVRGALRDSGASPEDVAEFTTAATSGSYDDLLRTVAVWVAVE